MGKRIVETMRRYDEAKDTIVETPTGSFTAKTLYYQESEVIESLDAPVIANFTGVHKAGMIEQKMRK